MDFATSKMNKLQNLTFSSPASKASREEPNFIKKTCELCFRFVTPPVCLSVTNFDLNYCHFTQHAF